MVQNSDLVLETTIINELGMHARPAAKIAELAMAAQGDVWLSSGTAQVDASSIIDILSLAAGRGAQIKIRAEKSEDRQIMEDIKAFFDTGFGEMGDA